MPETIKDLRVLQQEPINVIAGQNMLGDQKTIDEQIKNIVGSREIENQRLEQAGFDYNGEEAWAEAMRRVGRKR